MASFTPQRIIFHHSADDTEQPQFNKINEYHRTRGFPISTLGYYVGYHYLIEQDGTVKQARTDQEIGAHDQGENTNSIGICLAGNFNLRYPSEAQSASAALLIKQLRDKYKIPITRFEPHRWDDDTDCPGKLLPDNWLATQYLKRQGNQFERFFQQIGEYFNLI